MAISPLLPWLNCSRWQRAEVAGGEGGCPGLCGWGTWLQSYGRGLALGALQLFSLEVVGDGAADHTSLVLAALPLLAVTVFPACYGRGAVLGFARMTWTGLTVPRSSAGCCEGLNKRKSDPLSLHVQWWAQRCCLWLGIGSLTLNYLL